MNPRYYMFYSQWMKDLHIIVVEYRDPSTSTPPITSMWFGTYIVHPLASNVLTTKISLYAFLATNPFVHVPCISTDIDSIYTTGMTGELIAGDNRVYLDAGEDLIFVPHCSYLYLPLTVSSFNTGCGLGRTELCRKWYKCEDQHRNKQRGRGRDGSTPVAHASHTDFARSQSRLRSPCSGASVPGLRRI